MTLNNHKTCALSCAMRHLLFTLIALLAFGSASHAQDFFGHMAPTSQQKKEQNSKKKSPAKAVSLPDKPNKTDAQGRKQGQWAKKYPNGQYMYEATFKDDKPVGIVKRYSEDGKLTMTLKYDAKDTCRVVTYHINGKVESKGQYFNQKRVGDWFLYSFEGDLLSKEPYVDGKLHGVVYLFYDDGKVLEKTTYVDGSREGPWNKFFPSGLKKADGAFHMDREHGRFRTWGSDGKVSVDGQYDLGTKVGKWVVRYLDANNLTNTILYDHHGVITNKAEVDSIENLRIQFYEKNVGKYDDPANYVNNPDAYKPF